MELFNSSPWNLLKWANKDFKKQFFLIFSFQSTMKVPENRNMQCSPLPKRSFIDSKRHHFAKESTFFGLFEKRLCLFVPRYLVALKLTSKYFPQWRTLETRRIESETSGAVFASKKKIYRQNKREKNRNHIWDRWFGFRHFYPNLFAYTTTFYHSVFDSNKSGHKT